HRKTAEAARVTPLRTATPLKRGVNETVPYISFQFLLGVIFLCSSAAHAQVAGPLVINPIGDTNILLGSTLTLTASVTNNVSNSSLLWTLPSGPSGASITNSSTAANAAVFTWKPTAVSTNTVIVSVQDQFNQANTTSTSFRVGVFTNAIGGGPVLTLPFTETS